MRLPTSFLIEAGNCDAEWLWCTDKSIHKLLITPSDELEALMRPPQMGSSTQTGTPMGQCGNDDQRLLPAGMAPPPGLTIAVPLGMELSIGERTASGSPGIEERTAAGIQVATRPSDEADWPSDEMVATLQTFLQAKRKKGTHWRQMLSLHTTSQPRNGGECVSPLATGIQGCHTEGKLPNGLSWYKIDAPNAFRLGDGINWSVRAEGTNINNATSEACAKGLAKLLLMAPHHVRLLSKDWVVETDAIVAKALAMGEWGQQVGMIDQVDTVADRPVVNSSASLSHWPLWKIAEIAASHSYQTSLRDGSAAGSSPFESDAAQMMDGSDIHQSKGNKSCPPMFAI
jgi:hypothetical protein